MTFYFYDLETSGFNPRTDRIMQFAGQRTDLGLKLLGQPDNFLIKMTDDVLPEPDAVLVHGITPQKTRAEGISEADALKYLTSQVFVPDTITVGFNNIRFDDEFMRFLRWRNFYDAYEWQWKDGRSRWDLLDVVRMTRALRPEAIKWPFDSNGKPSNRLEQLADVNNLDHQNAHDALSDVMAAIAIARLIYNKQTKLFEYLLGLRDKQRVAALVTSGEPIVYTSGRYPDEYEKTTVTVMVGAHPDRGAALMYDLRADPNEFTGLGPAELAKLWQKRGRDEPYFPVKILSYNRCPAVAPLSVLDSRSITRLRLETKEIDRNLANLRVAKDFAEKLIKALEIMRPKTQPGLVVDELRVEEQLYDGFVSGVDKTKMSVVRATDSAELSSLSLDFADGRLTKLLPLYRARNFPGSLTGEERERWEDYRFKKLLGGGDDSRAAHFFGRLSELGSRPDLSADDRYLLEELQLYGQSVVPLGLV